MGPSIGGRHRARHPAQHVVVPGEPLRAPRARRPVAGPAVV